MKRLYSFFVSFLFLLPILYLFIRVLQMGKDSSRLFLTFSFFSSIFSSVLLVGGVVLLTTLLAIPSVLLIEKTTLPLRKIWNFLFILPITIPSFVGTFTLILALGPNGSLICQVFHLDHFVSIYGFVGATLGISLFTFPYIFLSTQMTLRSMHPHLDESALVMGMNKRSLVFHLWLPLLKKPLCFGSFLVSLYALSDFGTPMLMHYNSLTREIYLAYSGYFDSNYAASLSSILILLAFFILMLERFCFYRFPLSKDSRQMECHPYRISLGFFTIPALVWCVFVVFISVFLPIGSLIYWICSHRGHLSLGSSLSRSLQTCCVALSSGLLISVFMYPIAYLRERISGYWKKIAFMVYLDSAIPGIALALGITFFLKNFPIFYQSYGVLFLGYLILFGSRSFVILRSGISELSQSVEEVALTLGMNRWRVFRNVTFPLTKRAFTTSALLIAVSIMKELPLTLLLAPISYSSLVENIWTAMEEAFFTEASLSSLFLIMISSFLFLFFHILQRGRYEQLS